MTTVFFTYLQYARCNTLFKTQQNRLSNISLQCVTSTSRTLTQRMKQCGIIVCSTHQRKTNSFNYSVYISQVCTDPDTHTDTHTPSIRKYAICFMSKYFSCHITGHNCVIFKKNVTAKIKLVFVEIIDALK